MSIFTKLNIKYKRENNLQRIYIIRPFSFWDIRYLRSMKYFITSKQKQWNLLKFITHLEKNSNFHSLVTKEIYELGRPKFWGNHMNTSIYEY